jgi:hypothetical protein
MQEARNNLSNQQSGLLSSDNARAGKRGGIRSAALPMYEWLTARVWYGSINKMLELGLIEESNDRPDPPLDDERRRYYKITSFGRQVARAEAARMRELAEMAAITFGKARDA